jgi:hypothetical protein
MAVVGIYMFATVRKGGPETTALFIYNFSGIDSSLLPPVFKKEWCLFILSY